MGTATLNIFGSASITNDQPFSGTAIQSGLNVINASGATIPELDLGTLTDNSGGSVVLYGPPTITNLDGVTVTPATATITTTTADSPATSAAQSGFLEAGAINTINECGFVTVGLYDWASTFLTERHCGQRALHNCWWQHSSRAFTRLFPMLAAALPKTPQVNGATPVFWPSRRNFRSGSQLGHYK